jgi:hypothetical protein
MNTPIVAAYDALRMCRALERAGTGATAAELQVFAYLACLISIYDRHAPAEWGYAFTATPAGSPYAKSLAETTDRLRARGLVVDRVAPRHRRPQAPVAEEQSVKTGTGVAPIVLHISALGADELQALATLSSCRRRERFLEAATSAARLMPLPSVSDAVTYEPNLRRALSRLAMTELLDDEGVTTVQEQFEALADALREQPGQGTDLLVPTAIWITFLAETADAERPAA